MNNLAEVEKCVQKCSLCPLHRTRTKTVFAKGNPEADIVFIGEAPGADEDATGVPFVGRAGKLLDNILKECKLSLDDVYIINVLKCRPPGNRDPHDTEVSKCFQYLQKQLQFVNPKYVVCLGGVAARALLKTELTLMTLRGKWHTIEGFPFQVMCTYHPSYLLRIPTAKAVAWNDLQLLLTEIRGNE